MQFLVGNSLDLPRQWVHAMANYRYRVFVEHLGWQLRGEPGMELDDFDRPDTVYIIARGDHGRIIGCARLLPTTSPYLLSHVFPQLLDGKPAPCSPQVWELSRFAAMDPDDDSPAGFGFSSSPTAVALLRASMKSARDRGATELVTVSPQGVERLLRKAGFQARRCGPVRLIGTDWLFACSIAVDPRLTPLDA